MSKRSKRSGGRKNKSAGQPNQPSFERSVSSGNGKGNGNATQLAAASQGTGRRKPLREQAQDQLDGARSLVQSQIREIGDSVQTELQSELAGAKKLARSAGERIQQAAQTAQRGLQTAGRGVSDTVRDNPIPIAMAGIGLSWLAVSLVRGGSAGSSAARSVESTGGVRPQPQTGALNGALKQARRVAGTAAEAVQNAAGSVSESTSALVHDARTSVDGLTQGASEKLGLLTLGAQEQGRRVTTYIKETAEERPLWLGAAAIATGAALGFALPSTRRENQWFGGVRDKVVDQVEALARDAMDKVENRVEGAAQFLGMGSSGSSGSSSGKRTQNLEAGPRGRKQPAQA
jgi:hypothetical protein